MITDIRCDVVDAISKNNYANFNKKNSGDYISWLSNDLMIVEGKGFGNFLSKYYSNYRDVFSYSRTVCIPLVDYSFLYSNECSYISFTSSCTKIYTE